MPARVALDADDGIADMLDPTRDTDFLEESCEQPGVEMVGIAERTAIGRVVRTAGRPGRGGRCHAVADHVAELRVHAQFVGHAISQQRGGWIAASDLDSTGEGMEETFRFAVRATVPVIETHAELERRLGARDELVLVDVEHLQGVADRRDRRLADADDRNIGRFDQRDPHAFRVGQAPLQAVVEMRGGQPARRATADDHYVPDRFAHPRCLRGPALAEDPWLGQRASGRSMDSRSTMQ